MPARVHAPIIYRVVETGGPHDGPTFSRIRSALAGRLVLLTGVTGFLGTALLERLLSAVPDVRLVLLIRPRGGVPAATRLRQELIAGGAFDALRGSLGPDGLARIIDQRVTVVSGDSAPRAERTICLWNPPVIDEQLWLRASALGEGAKLLAELVSRGLRTLCFTKSRKATELVHRPTRP